MGGTAAYTLPPLLVVPAAAQSGTTLGTPSPGDPLAALGDRFEMIARQVAPSVVGGRGGQAGPKMLPGSTAKPKAVEESGSGVIVQFHNHKGYFVLTNNHVVAQAPPEQITVQLADGRIFKAARVWTDPESDVAILALDTPGPLPAATLGDSDRARVGQWVLAVGSPFGLNQTVTHGIISARERGQVSLGSTIRIKDFLQTDAAINPGSSGGPLVDLKGEIVGINTAIASHSGSNSGVAFSIPINLVKRVAHQLLEKGSVSRGYLGLQVAASFEAADAFEDRHGPRARAPGSSWCLRRHASRGSCWAEGPTTCRATGRRRRHQEREPLDQSDQAALSRGRKSGLPGLARQGDDHAGSGGGGVVQAAKPIWAVTLLPIPAGSATNPKAAA